MINRVSKAKLILREEGFPALCKRLLLFLKQFLFSYSSYNILESTLNSPDVTCEVVDLAIRVITRPDEINHLSYDGLYPSKFSRDKEIVNKGATLFYAFVGKELAHVTQVFIGRKAHKSYPFSFAMPYGHTVGLAAFTAPKYRRTGIHLYTRFKVLQYLREQGVSRAWDVQNKDNIAARDSLVKLGYYLWGGGARLRLLSLLTIEWTRPKSRVASRRIRCALNLK